MRRQITYHLSVCPVVPGEHLAVAGTSVYSQGSLLCIKKNM